MLLAYAQGKRCIVEYGSGGSTPFLLRTTKARVISVESDPAWAAAVRADPACDTERLTLIELDLGPVGVNGKPTDFSRKDAWPTYWKAPWRHRPKPGLVLVDGRFRVCCALYSALRVDAPILMHDFWLSRGYNVLQRHLKVTDCQRSLVCLRRRDTFDPLDVEDEIERHKEDRR